MATYTVSQITSEIRELLESSPFLADLWIEGEISNLSIASSGHAYFNLKDQNAVLQAVMFRNRRGIELLSNGIAVTAHGQVSFYEPRGTLNISVDVVAPQGLGELALELERLKEKLASEGLFDQARKRPLPTFPKVIGVVTSPTGAVFCDIQNVLSRRYPLAKLVLSPTMVQGAQAKESIARALKRLDDEGGCDVIIIARGGGSPEDLWPFNEEEVARAIYACRTPVVSGVGHETDDTISDYVADVRAPTPSAAAELVTPDIRDLKAAVTHFSKAMARNLSGRLQQERGLVDNVRRRLGSGLPDIGTLRRRVDDQSRIAAKGVKFLAKERRLEVEGLYQRLRGLDPGATLSRGFAIVELTDSGQALTSVKQARPGDSLSIRVADGEVPAIAGFTPQAPAAPDSATKKKRSKSKPAPASAALF